MSWRKLILLTICAALTFGGTFTCKSDNNSATITDEPTTRN